MTSSTPTIGTKVGRARQRSGQLWQVPTFLFGLLALIGAAVSAPWRQSPEAREFAELVHTIRHGLQDPNTPGELLVAQSENALLWQIKFPNREAETHFLAGSAYYQLAQQKPAPYAKELWPRAVLHLEKSLAMPLADSDRPAAEYRLGYSLYHLGKEIPRAVELMTQATDKGTEQPLQGYRILMEANLKLSPPNLEAALAAGRRILDLTSEENVETIAQARLDIAQLLIRKEQRGDALKELDLISKKISRPLRVKTRLLQARCCEEEGQWSRACLLWQELLQKDAALVDGGRARIYYAIGVCFREMEPANPAEAIKAWTEALQLGGPAGQASGLEMGGLRITLGDKEYSRALEDWNTAMERVNSPEQYKNPYLPLQDVLKWFDRAIQLFNEKQDPQKTQIVAELYRKLVPGGVADQKVASAIEEHAKQLKKRGAQTEVVAAEFRRAGEAYERAAKAHKETERPAMLWRSIQCYLAGKDGTSPKDIKHTQDLLRQYVDWEKSEVKLAEAWFVLGEQYLLAGGIDNAHRAFVACGQYHQSPFAGRARYYLAIEEINKKNYEVAREILDQNLQMPTDRASKEKSLFKMAWLLMQMSDHNKACVLLEDCINEYPENPNVIVAREQLGECYRRLAGKIHEKELDLENTIRGGGITPERKEILEKELRAQRANRFRDLDLAKKAYGKLTDELAGRVSAGKTLTSVEQLLLRRARFGMAECHLDMEQYQEGVRIFADLQKQHRATQEGFYAGVRICNVAQVLKTLAKGPYYRDKAKEALPLLEEDLKAMPADHELFKSDKFTRQRWQTWLNDVRKEFFAPLPNDQPIPPLR